ncbi:transmembrane protein 248 isoform X2 [Syngnathoides biaculeatus]|uniref:transmembrane protein 248 isoform X2 n=1 Tax=Syngnathoides biaculeatus TaxID=300417 RepID=UPI002ADE041F|nr:transmembrane protein 248 isoform X2 [Syngnathoides biaculeatus]
MMASWQPVSNVKDFVSQNPPAVTFFLCLLTLAISFICLGSYSNNHTLPNPDTVKDWNHLLSALAHFHLCVKSNRSSDEPVDPLPSPLPQKKAEVDASLGLPSQPTTVDSLHLKVPVAVTSSNGLPKNADLFTTFTARQLNLGGDEIVSVHIHSEYDTYTCLSIKAPTALFPMNQLPPECPASGNTLSSVHVEAIDQTPPASRACYRLLSRNDPSFAVMLTKEHFIES